MRYATAPLSQSVRVSAAQAVVVPVKLLHWWLNLPVAMFLLTMTAMLFRPPDLKCFPIDRLALLALIVLVCLRGLICRELPRIYPATWPLLGLLLVGLWGALSQPYDAQVWSVFAAKYAVPFVCFQVAGLIFADKRSLRTFEIFLLIVLVYLTAISLFALLGASSFIFPGFITDEGIGIHADRARGPFLQAVANGVSLNLLGLIALDSFRRRKLPGIVSAFLFLALPLAIIATKTRAVWLSAALSAAALVSFGSAKRIRRVALALCLLGVMAGGVLLIYRADESSFAERLVDRSPVDFRTEMYSAGWQMFTEKPLFGWGNEWVIQPEIEKRVSSFRPEYYVFHNTFLELAVERGLIGLGLYAWVMICLSRLRKPNAASPEIDAPFSGVRALWPLLLLVYLINASAVVMNYQFVNALLFTIAGILAADSGRSTLVKNFQHTWASA
jgi:O-antigen ligase